MHGLETAQRVVDAPLLVTDDETGDALRQRLQQACDFETSKMHPDADMRAEPEADMVPCVATHIEYLGAFPGTFIPVRRGIKQQHPRARWQLDTVELCIPREHAGEAAHGRLPSNAFIDRARYEAPVASHQVPLIRKSCERAHDVPRGKDGGVEARADIITHHGRTFVARNITTFRRPPDRGGPAIGAQRSDRRRVPAIGVQLFDLRHGRLRTSIHGSERIEGRARPFQHVAAAFLRQTDKARDDRDR
ncbi:hypothetical protein ACVWW3_006430 [Bradyrhizobium sp. LM2.9]